MVLPTVDHFGRIVRYENPVMFLPARLSMLVSVANRDKLPVNAVSYH
jgi:hypothetical protein